MPLVASQTLTHDEILGPLEEGHAKRGSSAKDTH